MHQTRLALAEELRILKDLLVVLEVPAGDHLEDCLHRLDKIANAEPDAGVDLSVAGVRRYEDMSPDGFMRIFQEPDGDLIVYIAGERFGLFVAASAQFCQVGGGGGRSPHTRQALLDLANAMDRDNKENPQERESR